MKKYRLIKEYPGSPELGTIIQQHSEFWQEIAEIVEIPEYVKCIDIWDVHKKSIVGKIYKTSEKADFIDHEWDCILTITGCFIPSTKEEYDEQESKNLMQECIKRFPKGSKVRCAQDGKIYTIALSYRYYDTMHVDEVYYYTYYKKYIAAVSTNGLIGFYLYYNGKYAELIEELDYEILSFVRDESSNEYKGTIFTLSSNGTYNPNFKQSNLTLEHCLKGGFNIHSVKRLSDGEVFTVGETLTLNHKITSFELQAETMFIWLEDKVSRWHSNIASLVKLKQPLFTTEDGVDIFKGDTVYYTLRNPNHNCSSPLESKWCEYAIAHAENIHFSTKEAAEEYILFNKPCLSINDLKKFNDEFFYLSQYFIEKVKNEVRNKVKTQ